MSIPCLQSQKDSSAEIRQKFILLYRDFCWKTDVTGTDTKQQDELNKFIYSLSTCIPYIFPTSFMKSKKLFIYHSRIWTKGWLKNIHKPPAWGSKYLRIKRQTHAENDNLFHKNEISMLSYLLRTYWLWTSKRQF